MSSSIPAIHAPFKTHPHLIKSDWHHTSFLSRKQVRILIDDSGKLAIQTIAQNSFAQLASMILKRLTWGRLKSFGKRVESFTFSEYTLPKNLTVPLTEAKQKKLIDLQCEILILHFLPTHKSLSDLGAQLVDEALGDVDNCDEEVRQKTLDLCQKILDTQLLFSEEIQKDLSPSELYGKFQEYEKQAKRMCEEFPQILKDFIAQHPKVQESDVDETPAPVSQEQQNYESILNFAQEHVTDLKKRFQFNSAQFLESEIQKAINFRETDLTSAIEILEDALDCTEEQVDSVTQFLSLPIDSPYEQNLKEMIIEDIRNALSEFKKQLHEKNEDVTQLFAETEKSSWHVQLFQLIEISSLKADALATTHNCFESQIPGFEEAMLYLNLWLSNENPIVPLESLDRQTLANHKYAVDYFCKNTIDSIEDQTKVSAILKLRTEYFKLTTLATSKLDALEQNRQYLHLELLNNCLNKYAKLINNALTLTDSYKCQRCASRLQEAVTSIQERLDHIERHEMDPVEQLDGFNQPDSPYYKKHRTNLLDNAKIELNTYTEILNNYEKILNASIPALKESHPDMIEGLENLKLIIDHKNSEARALTVDFVTRLHFWQLFSASEPINELPPHALKNYLNTVWHLIQAGLYEVRNEAADAGFKFN